MLPLDLGADADLAVVEHFGESAAAPVRPHGGFQPGQGLVHPLARLGLTGDAQPAGADAQDATAGFGQRDAAQQQVGAPRHRRDVGTEVAHQGAPDLVLDQRDLAAPALIGIADEPALAAQLRRLHGVHLAAAGALDPDGDEFSRHGGASAMSMRASALRITATSVGRTSRVTSWPSFRNTSVGHSFTPKERPSRRRLASAILM